MAIAKKRIAALVLAAMVSVAGAMAASATLAAKDAHAFAGESGTGKTMSAGYSFNPPNG